VRKYSIYARPRINGQKLDHLVHAEIGVRRAAWDFAKWPGDLTSTQAGRKPFYDEDQDYVVLRLKAQPDLALEPASIGVADPDPVGKEIELVHYPTALIRGFELYNSVGDMV
jgi:hypothetical protein